MFIYVTLSRHTGKDLVQFFFCLPGQRFVLHDSVAFKLAPQSFPRGTMGGKKQSLSRCRVPVPHETEQLLHMPQDVNVPSTRMENRSVVL